MTKNILIVYASNSGSTFLVGEMIKNYLSKKYTVAMQTAAMTQPDDLEKYDIILLGSPSWHVLSRGDGFPQETMLAFMERCAGRSFPDKRFAAFGCGDSDYTLFCGAVFRLETFIGKLQGQKIMEPLKVDSYFFRPVEGDKQVEQWAGELMKKIS